MKNKKSLFIKIGCFLMAIAVAIIPFLSFAKPSDKAYAADDVTLQYTYNSSNIYVPIVRDSYPYCTDYLFLHFSIVSSDDVVITFDNSLFFYDGYTGSGTESRNYSYVSSLPILDSSQSLVVGTSDTNYKFTYAGYYYSFIIGRTSGFNANIKWIVFDNFLGSYDIGWNRVRLYSDADNYLSLSFQSLYIQDSNPLIVDDVLFASRVYYLSTNFNDSELYDTGYNDGYREGSHIGYNDGFRDGDDYGYNIGVGVGYNKGVAESNDYSFLSLFGAVVDAPIQAFSGLLNFNVLGVNLAPFLLALFSVAIIIVIIKMLKG